MKLKYLVIAVLSGIALPGVAGQRDVYTTSTRIQDCGGCENFVGNQTKGNNPLAVPPMQVKIAWIDGDGTSSPPALPPVPPPLPPKFSSPLPLPIAPVGPPVAGGNGPSGGGQSGSGDSAGGADGDGPPVPPQGGPKAPPAGHDDGPPPQGVPPIETVLLNLLPPPSDDPGVGLPTFVEAAVLPPGNDAVILAVPEPGLLSLLGLAMLGLLAFVRTRRQQG